MKKEEIFVKIDNEEKRLRAIQILNDAGEKIWSTSCIFDKGNIGNVILDDGEWIYSYDVEQLTEVALDQLEQILAHKEVHLTIDELRLQAERFGFELVEKKREVKIGDFGLFWDDEDTEIGCYGFVKGCNGIGFKDNYHTSNWQNFRHLTDEEKERITQNW